MKIVHKILCASYVIFVLYKGKTRLIYNNINIYETSFQQTLIFRLKMYIYIIILQEKLTIQRRFMLSVGVASCYLYNARVGHIDINVNT